MPTRTFPLFRRIVIAIKEAKPGELIARLTVVGSVGYSANGQSMFPRPIYEQDVITAVVNRNKSFYKGFSNVRFQPRQFVILK